jgi:hypothetical protein
MRELSWSPSVPMAVALRGIFDSYRGEIEAARGLMAG